MRLKVITTVSTRAYAGFGVLEKSLRRLGYDYEVIENAGIQWAWSGLPDIYAWCERNRGEYTHFLYTDGFDTLALAGQDEVEAKYKDREKFLFSGEKGCFPRVDWSELHGEGVWKYLNHGQFIAPVELFLREYAGVFGLPLTCQEFAMERHLFSGSDVWKIDVGCEVFQSAAFRGDGEFTVKDGRVMNNITGSSPCLLHYNGQTERYLDKELFGL